MNKPIGVIFPPGAGGTWLQHVIYGLLNKDYSIKKSDSCGFHNGSRTGDLRKHKIVINHYNLVLMLLEDVDPSLIPRFSNQNAKFNFYVNVIIKFIQNFRNKEFKLASIYKVSERRLIPLLKDNAFNGPSDVNIQLDYKDLYTNPTNFINNIYQIFDVEHNDEYILKMIEEYKISCIGLAESVYCNDDSLIWWQWCHGVLVFNNVSIDFDVKNVSNNNLSELIEIYKSHYDLILPFTENQWIKNE